VDGFTLQTIFGLTEKTARDSLDSIRSDFIGRPFFTTLSSARPFNGMPAPENLLPSLPSPPIVVEGRRVS
jgi:hypothetical protein